MNRNRDMWGKVEGNRIKKQSINNFIAMSQKAKLLNDANRMGKDSCWRRSNCSGLG